jgi:outer membrane protein OmpA-like peptidoglycan-associated protein
VELEHEKVKAVADVTDVRSGQRMKMKVAYNNESTGEVIVADAGESVLLRKGDRYQVVTTSNEGYSYAIANIEAQASASNEPLAINMPVTQLVEGAKLMLNHIYFKTNSADLNETSTLELKSIVELLKNNPRLVIEISAHTDDVGSDGYNLQLSQKRASSVTTYINKNGIALQQLVAKGYGKNQPIAPNDSEENRAKNRRVELLIVKGN